MTTPPIAPSTDIGDFHACIDDPNRVVGQTASAVADTLGLTAEFIHDHVAPQSHYYPELTYQIKRIPLYDTEAIRDWLATDAGKAALTAYKAIKKAVKSQDAVVVSGEFQIKSWVMIAGQMAPRTTIVSGTWRCKPDAQFGYFDDGSGKPKRKAARCVTPIRAQ